MDSANVAVWSGSDAFPLSSTKAGRESAAHAASRPPRGRRPRVVPIAPSNRAMAGVKFVGGWFVDRIAFAVPLPPGDGSRADGVMSVMNASPDVTVDYVEVGRKGRNQGLQGTWQSQWHLNRAKGEPGRIFVRHTEVGAGAESSMSMYLEFNPSHVTADELGGLGRVLVDGLGASIDGAIVHRFDATRDLLGRCDQFVIDDRLRKWMAIGTGHRETMKVGKGGPLEVQLYDKRKQMLEVHGVDLVHELTRLEIAVRPSKSVYGDVAGVRCVIPEDRSFASLPSWPFPYRGGKGSIRHCDPMACEDVQFFGLLLAAQCMGVRPVVSLAKRRMSAARVRNLVECMPVVDVESDWAATWGESASMLLSALKGEAWSACSERRAA